MHLANHMLTCLPVPLLLNPPLPLSAPRANHSHCASSSVSENLDLNYRATARPNYPDCKGLSRLEDKGVAQSPQQTENPASRCETRDRTVWKSGAPQPPARSSKQTHPPTNVICGCKMVEIFACTTLFTRARPASRRYLQLSQSSTRISCCGVTAVREIDDTKLTTDQTSHFCASRPVPRKLSSLTGIFP